MFYLWFNEGAGGLGEIGYGDVGLWVNLSKTLFKDYSYSDTLGD